MEQTSFIEKQFPVSKISKESYKERKANNGQTLTGLGKWWGRKPLILVRAVILGCLMPVGIDPRKDTEIFLKILGMDNEGLWLRKEKKIPLKELYAHVNANKSLSNLYSTYFEDNNGKIVISKDAPKDNIEKAVFYSLGYDEKIALCCRPEQLGNISEQSWNEINHYLGTSAHSLVELIRELSIKKYGRNIIIGDCFCGGGSIPFEAARMGCDVFASDLNPIAGVLTWSDLNIAGADNEKVKQLQEYQQKVFDEVDKELVNLGVETAENGDRAVSYIYCVEAKCPECGNWIPMAPSWIIGKGTKTVAKLVKNGMRYDFEVKMNASKEELFEANKGTVTSKGLVCPCCGKTTPISSLRHDMVDKNGETIYGLRQWGKEEFQAKNDDVYQERLYAIKYQNNGENKYYKAPDARDLKNEEKVIKIVADHFEKWQKSGLISSLEIESGFNTDQLVRERGWKYWHQLFTARQILMVVLFQQKAIALAQSDAQYVVALLGINRMLNWNSKLSQWSSYHTQECGLQTFYNQAFNTFFNYADRALYSLKATWLFSINNQPLDSDNTIELSNATEVTSNCDYWITDPPYADAVNYHELSEFFLSWDKILLQKAFKNWYTDSKRILAVRGDEHFSNTMIDIYSNLARHMNDDGGQVVMFTHSDPAVWAQLAIIMWRAGLKVTAAWNIATETDVGGIHSGNYVKGTVLLVLRKQTGSDVAFLDEISADIRNEVKSQIASMQALDDKEEPNFADPDYVLAAYAASLKVLTSYASIEDLDLDYELNQAIKNPSESQVVTIIENAKKVAYDCVIPLQFDSYLWRDLTNSEKFYIKGLESEKHGLYQISTYQEFARGFSISGYSQMMANEKANSARLKTPFEMASRTMSDAPDFDKSLTRTVFQAIYSGIKEDMNPNKALGFLKNELPNYWDRREMIQQILSFLVDIKDISNMQPHWTDSASMAEMLLAMVKNDSI